MFFSKSLIVIFLFFGQFFCLFWKALVDSSTKSLVTSPKPPKSKYQKSPQIIYSSTQAYPDFMDAWDHSIHRHRCTQAYIYGEIQRFRSSNILKLFTDSVCVCVFLLCVCVHVCVCVRALGVCLCVCL